MDSARAQYVSESGTLGMDAASAQYVEWAPHPALAEHVVCTWRDPAGPHVLPVLPDACIDLVWDGKSVVVAGPDTHAVPVDGARTFVGIRFKPGAAPGFLGVPASELRDARVDLSDLWGARAAGDLACALADAPENATHLLEESLLARLPQAPVADPLIIALIALQRTSLAALARQRDLAGDFGVCERTLRRRCIAAVGYGPKTLERILRFRHALRLLAHRQVLAEAAHLAGYADQAHFTNEAQRLAGKTPAALAATPKLSISTNGCN